MPLHFYCMIRTDQSDQALFLQYGHPYKHSESRDIDVSDKACSG